MTEFPVVAEADADLTNFVSAFAAGSAALATFGVAAGAATAGIGTAAAALGPAIMAASEFQDEIIRLNTLVGISENQMQDFEESILQLAPALGQTPEELARAMFAITSGGERSAAAVDLLEQSAKAARLGLGDTAVIARVGTAALQAFAGQGLTAAEAIDIMVGTVREGNLVAEELPNAFGRVIGIAGQMGVTFQEVGTFMATFTRLGVSSEIAATSLRATLFALLNPGKEAKKTFDELGLSVEVMQRKIREDGLTDAMLDLLAATEGNLDTLSDIIPNIRAMSGVLGVYAAQADQVVEIQKNMNNIMGVTDEGFQRIQGNASNAMAELKAEIQTLAVTIGSIFLPVTADVIEAINLIVSAIGGAATDFANWTGDVIEFGADFSRAAVGMQDDASDLADTMAEIEPRLQGATSKQLQRSLELARQRQDEIGQMQIAGTGDPGDLNRRMNLQIALEERINEVLSKRTDLVPKLIEGVRVVIGQTEEQEEATRKLEDKLNDQLMTEQGLERQLLENELTALDVERADRLRILAIFDAIEAEEAEQEALKERAKQLRINEQAMERLRRARERQFSGNRRQAEDDARSQREADAALATEIMVSRISDALDRQQQVVEEVSRVMLNSFENMIRGTESVSDAFGNMVTNILAEFARLKLEQALVGLLTNLLIPVPQAPGAFQAPTIDPTAGLNALPAITGPGAVASAGFQGAKVVVQQSINFSPNLIDARSGRQFIQEQGETIVELVGRGARTSASFANALRG